MEDHALRSYVLITTHHRCRCGQEAATSTLMGVIHSGRRPFRVLIKPAATLYKLPVASETRYSTTEMCLSCSETVTLIPLPESFIPARPPQNAPPKPKPGKGKIDLEDLGF